MSFYIGRYAELYDFFYQDKPYSKEADKINYWLNKYSSKRPLNLLELACGTGNHSFHLTQFGYHISALDYSKDMIMQAKKKNKTTKTSIDFMRGDMRKLPEFKKKFDAAYCLFDSIGYVCTNESIIQVLLEVKKNITKDSIFIFEFWHAPAMLRHYDPKRERTLILPNKNRVKRISNTSIDYGKNIASVQYDITEYKSNKVISHMKETQKNRFFSIPEMQLFLTTTGFTPLKFFDGYSDTDFITDNTWHVVAIAQRN